MTDVAATAAGRWAGCGDKEAGDKIAVDQMLQMLSHPSALRRITVIGEGEEERGHDAGQQRRGG